MTQDLNVSVVVDQKYTPSIDPFRQEIDPLTLLLVSHVITTRLMTYQRVLGVYKRSVF